MNSNSSVYDANANCSEELNALVRAHILVVTSRPQRALATLEHDVSELINAGMVTLNSKLMNVDDEQLLNRVVELWGFFWDQVLPYVEGVRNNTFISSSSYKFSI